MNITPILHNIRSLHNVGSILRTCDGLGIQEVWVSGYTPYPQITGDKRLPHVQKRATKQIAKTALGAEESVAIKQFDTFDDLVTHARKLGLKLVAVEQDASSTTLDEFVPDGSIGLVLGNEVDGLDKKTLKSCEEIVEIPMLGSKESFNVAVTAGIVLYTVASQLQD